MDRFFININQRKNQKGFTMLEVIISAAILAMLAISLIPLLSYGYSETVLSGKKSIAVYKDAESLEANLNNTTDGITSITAKTLTISFGETVVTVVGKLYQAHVTYDANRGDAEIKAFKPD
ncbi:MAG: prepilin-type N-terminal cleavage/methylation domain-containing protein [Clostridia bacterium]